MKRFDKLINRANTDSMKYEKYPEKVIPAWVADMDFLSPKCVIEDLKNRVEHGVFGYTKPSKEVQKSIVNFAFRHYGWQIEPNWLVFTSGVVASMNVACSMFSQNDSMITLNPIYPYFFNIPKSLNQEIIRVDMRDINNRWSVDFDEFEKAIKPNTKMMLLCNPFNPGGTVFTKEELENFAFLAKKYDLIILSDEIHADLILNPNAKHIPIASLSQESANRTITLQAPSKTFNIAGLQSSYAIIKNLELKKRFVNAMGHLNGGVNLLGLCATKSALDGGDEWLSALKQYLQINLNLVQTFVKNNSNLKQLSHDATYLAWIDARALHVDAYEHFLKHGVALNNGKNFGGDGFVRLNFGCPTMLLNEILNRLQKAMDNL